MKAATNRKLKRIADPTFSPEGVPRVLVPDEVFHRGTELHKDFIIGIFVGKILSFGHIQNILSYVWRRGQKIKIHLQPAKRSMLVRIGEKDSRTGDLVCGQHLVLCSSVES